MGIGCRGRNAECREGVRSQESGVRSQKLIISPPAPLLPYSPCSPAPPAPPALPIPGSLFPKIEHDSLAPTKTLRSIC